MTLFRPCIDLHDGKVKQIVGGSLRDQGPGLRTNFVAEHDAAWFAQLYRQDGLEGAHVIRLGPGNDDATRAALAAWPQQLHLGGGITHDNARSWLEAGAGKLIVTSWLFVDRSLSLVRAQALADQVGAQQLVFDLSCRRTVDGWVVATDRWQTLTTTRLGPELFAQLAPFCCEFLIHAVDVEGLCRGIDEDLVRLLAHWSPHPCTYAGGGRALADLSTVAELSQGRVDLTFGSALDLFGGTLVRYADCVAWNRAQGQQPAAATIP